MQLLFIIFLSFAIVEAQSIDSLINYSMKKHHSLQSIKHHLLSMDERISKSQKWENPDISATINDIQFRKPLSRDEERMQYQALNFKQKIPWFGKLSARKIFAEENKHVLIHTLEAAQVQLAYNIRSTAYTLMELEVRTAILRQYISLVKQNIKLYTDTIATDNMSHADSIEATIALSKIEIRLESYQSLYQVQKEKLHYLVQKKVKNISNKLSITKPKPLSYYLEGVRKNPNYHQRLAKHDVAKANKKLVDLEIHPDPYVKVGYFNRIDSPDFASITVGMSLPIYGTEELNSEIAKLEALSSKSDALDYKAYVKSEIQTQYVKLKEAYKIYTIIQNKSLPQLEHMLELSSSAIEEGSDLFTYTKILEKKLLLEEERISIIATFMRTQAKLKSLIGIK